MIIIIGFCFIFLRLFYLSGGRCKSTASMAGKTVVITGANQGVGAAATLDLARRGARVIMACRNIISGEQTAADVRRKFPGADVVVMKLDLASLKSIRQFCEDLAKKERSLHVLINNAGVYYHPATKTEDGFDTTFAINYLGHFLLTNLLLDLLKKSAPSRVVLVSSWMHKNGKLEFDNLNGERLYNKNAIYSASRLAVMLFGRELNGRLIDDGVTVYITDPGVVNTNAGRYMKETWSPIFRFIIGVLLGKPLLWLFTKTPMQGAQTIIHCSVSDGIEGSSGRYFVDCKEQECSKVDGIDEGVGKKLWDVSERMTGLA